MPGLVYDRIISRTPSTYPEWNTPLGSTTYTNVPAIRFSYDQWSTYSGFDYTDGGIDGIDGLYAIIRVYDRTNYVTTNGNTQISLEQGCQKYDKFYNENYITTVYDNEIIYYDKLSYILAYEAIDIEKNINNNIQEHFITHLNQFVNYSFNLQEQKDEIKKIKDKELRKEKYKEKQNIDL